MADATLSDIAVGEMGAAGAAPAEDASWGRADGVATGGGGTGKAASGVRAVPRRGPVSRVGLEQTGNVLDGGGEPRELIADEFCGTIAEALGLGTGC
ncbi:hypothetical protein GCM10010339_17440 [Streptomyces alanosinicus]|uniref:Uncharacterized protein n=1 Tax=Streptomyces alanosinicus TaxID=68171 RepID=A0A918YF43_9ACTN|nr:hypothetical protein GCM10010339_17440 [Streptomyces alanosinicus]